MALKLSREVDKEGFEKAVGEYWRISNVVEVRPGNKRETSFTSFTVELWEDKATRNVKGAEPLKKYELQISNPPYRPADLAVEGMTLYKWLYQWLGDNISELNGATDD